jgi:CRISPR-associated protein Csb2
MLALRLDYLTGRSYATEYNDRARAEWPPHPSRVFSALVAAWADDEDPTERAALEWLEAAGAPAIAASPATARSIVPHFVPVNDAKLQTGKGELKSARGLLPAERVRQPRFFPSVTPADPTVHVVWSADPPPSVRAALDTLSRRVVRVGHSASLVRCRVVDDPPTADWVPDPDADMVLRVPGPGQLGALAAEFARHRAEEPRVLPTRFQRYRAGAREQLAEIPGGVFAPRDWIVFRRVSGPRLPVTRAVDVTAALRGALLKHATAYPEALTGHADAGGPSEQPHVALLALPFVGREHADGAILGVSVVLPRGLDPAQRRAVFAAVGRWEQAAREGLGDPAIEAPPLTLFLGRAGVLTVERVVWGEAAVSTLRPGAWTRPSRAWRSVTPVALDRNPGRLDDRDPVRAAAAWRAAEETIARSCVHIGLPRPAHVQLLPSVPVAGSAKASAFPAFPPAEARLRRVKAHARLEFEEPVFGPVLLGAGRYAGLGLFRPDDGSDDADEG